MKPPADTPPPPSRMGAVLLGVARVARGRKDGLLQFGDSPEAVLAALAPLLAFLMVGAVLSLVGGSRDAVEYVALATVVLLGPLVFSFEIARRWGRARQWFRFATAFCWCQWAGPMMLAGAMLLMMLLMAAGVDGNAATGIGMAVLFGYGVWLHWFLARNALDLKPGRALVLVIAMMVLTFLVTLLPEMADYALNGPPPAS